MRFCPGHNAILALGLMGLFIVVPCAVLAGETDDLWFVTSTPSTEETNEQLTPETIFHAEATDFPTATIPSQRPLTAPTHQNSAAITLATYEETAAPDTERTPSVEMASSAVAAAPGAIESNDLIAGDDANEPAGENATDEKPAKALPKSNTFASLEKLGQGPPSIIANLPRLILTTCFVLAACGTTLFLARRWLMKAGMVVEPQRRRRLRITESLSIAPRTQLHIVKFDDREVLVGVDSRGLQQMHFVTRPFDEVLQHTQTENEPGNDAVTSASDNGPLRLPPRIRTAA